MKLGLYSITYLGLWYRGEALPLPAMIKTAKCCVTSCPSSTARRWTSDTPARTPNWRPSSCVN